MKNEKNELMSYKIDINPATGDASFTLDISEPKIVHLTYGTEFFDLFVEPTDDLKILFEGGQMRQSIRFEGKGAVNNKVLAHYQRFYRGEFPVEYTSHFLNPYLDRYTESRATSAPDARTFLSIIYADKESAIHYLSAQKTRIHKSLYSLLWKETQYFHDTQLYAYFLFKAHSADAFRLTSQLFFPSKGFNYTDYERNDAPVFRNALKAFVHYQALQFGEKNDDDPNALYETIEKKLDGYDRFWLEKELLIEVLNKTQNLSFGRQHIERFRKGCTFPELIREVDDAYQQYLDVTERSEAPDFSLIKTDHTPISLKAFRGKVVYISFWASWCQPCIANFEKYNELRNRLHTEGVVLLNVNIDEQPAKYRAALERLNLVGVNVQPMEMATTKKLYSLYAIPSYFIVDKKGKFAHLSDKEGRDVLGEFRKLLAEN
jgi:peroxiredoxin